jgi:hypothetical protein
MSTALGHVLGHAGLSDLKAELEQLAMNASPQRIIHGHLPDQQQEVGVDLRPVCVPRTPSVLI